MGTATMGSGGRRKRARGAYRAEMDYEALLRGTRFEPRGNDVAVMAEFSRRGIALDDIQTFGPAQNVRTYRAWRALGRQVQRGERGVRITVYGQAEPGPEVRIDATGAVCEPAAPRRFACSAHVFHITQTAPIGEAVAAESERAAC